MKYFEKIKDIYIRDQNESLTSASEDLDLKRTVNLEKFDEKKLF